MKFNIPSDAKCGVYILRSLKTKDDYVGATQSFKTRFSQHKSVSSKANSKLGVYIRKHGIESLSMDLLEVCSKELRFNREEYFIQILQPSLNCIDRTGVGGRPLKYGGKTIVVAFRVIDDDKFIAELRAFIRLKMEEYYRNHKNKLSNYLK